jgi:hypothetical protein
MVLNAGAREGVHYPGGRRISSSRVTGPDTYSGAPHLSHELKGCGARRERPGAAKHQSPPNSVLKVSKSICIPFRTVLQ